MTQKRRLNTTSLMDKICEFAEKIATPDTYANSKEPETEMQIHFGKYMSKCWSVVREVNVPAKAEIDGCGEGNWEIDETIYVEGMFNTIFYVTGELKLHTTKMCDTRNFCDEVVADVKRMKYISREYFNVPMGFALFITCDKKECDAIVRGIRNMQDINNYIIKENGQYYALIVEIIPSCSSSPYDYFSHWSDRMNYLKKKKLLKNNSFPKL